MAIEIFSWNLIDSLGEPITGATPLVKIRRQSDGFSFDWDDDTFKSSGWTTISSAMTEVGAPYPGLYEISLDSTLSGEYQIFMESGYYSSSTQFSLQDGTLVQGGLTSQQTTMLLEMYDLLGLDPTKPLTVTATTREAGSISQTIDSTTGSTVVTRV